MFMEKSMQIVLTWELWEQRIDQIGHCSSSEASSRNDHSLDWGQRALRPQGYVDKNHKACKVPRPSRPMSWSSVMSGRFASVKNSAADKRSLTFLSVSIRNASDRANTNQATKAYCKSASKSFCNIISIIAFIWLLYQSDRRLKIIFLRKHCGCRYISFALWVQRSKPIVSLWNVRIILAFDPCQQAEFWKSRTIQTTAKCE